MFRILTVALPALSLLVLSGCGGDRSSDGSDAGVAKYFADYGAISDDGEARIADLGDKYPALSRVMFSRPRTLTANTW